MSKLDPEAIACPACGVCSTHRIARSVNGARAPALRAAILGGSFHRITCAACAASFVVDVRFTYVDFTRRQCYLHCPLADQARWRALEGEITSVWEQERTRLPAMLADLSEGIQLRTVFGLAALREKLICHEAGIDDRLLEASKLNLLRAPSAAALAPEAQLRLIEAGDAELRFAAIPASGGTLVVPRTALDEVATEAWAKVVALLSAGSFVDLARIRGA